MLHSLKDSHKLAETAQQPPQQISWRQAKKSYPEIQGLLDQGKKPSEIAQTLSDRHNVLVVLPEFRHLALPHPRGLGSSPYEDHASLILELSKKHRPAGIVSELNKLSLSFRPNAKSLASWLVRFEKRLKKEKHKEAELIELVKWIKHKSSLQISVLEQPHHSLLSGKTADKKPLYNTGSLESPSGIITAE